MTDSDRRLTVLHLGAPGLAGPGQALHAWDWGQELARHVLDQRWRPDILAVSGPVSREPEGAGLAAAARLLQGLLEGLELPPEALVAAPGPEDYADEWALVAVDEQDPWRGLWGFRRLLQTVGQDPDPDSPPAAWRVSRPDVLAVPVLLEPLASTRSKVLLGLEKAPASALRASGLPTGPEAGTEPAPASLRLPDFPEAVLEPAPAHVVVVSHLPVDESAPLATELSGYGLEISLIVQGRGAVPVWLAGEQGRTAVCALPPAEDRPADGLPLQVIELSEEKVVVTTGRFAARWYLGSQGSRRDPVRPSRRRGPEQTVQVLRLGPGAPTAEGAEFVEDGTIAAPTPRPEDLHGSSDDELLRLYGARGWKSEALERALVKGRPRGGRDFVRAVLSLHDALPYRADDADAAAHWLEEAYQAAEAADVDELVVEVLLGIARRQVEDGHLGAAERAAREALERLQDPGHGGAHGERARTLLLAAETMLQAGQLALAEESYRQLPAGAGPEAEEWAFQRNLGLAQVARLRGNVGEAGARLHRAAAIARPRYQELDKDDPAHHEWDARLFELRARIVDLYLLAGLYGLAAREFGEPEWAYNHPDLWSRLRRLRGEIKMRYGSLDEARRSFVRARGFAASRGSGLERASCERLLGDVACLRGNAHEAHTAYVRAERDLAGSAVRGSEEARLRLSQGRLAWRAGRLRQAEILLGQASESAQRCGDLLLLGHVRLEQAWCGLFSGDWADAWAQAQEASEAAHRRGHGWGELEAETVAALARWLSGEAAEPLLRSDLPGSPHPEPGDQRDVLQTLAVGLPATGGLLAHGTRSGQELWPSPAPAVDGPWLEVLDRHLDEGAEVRDADLDVARTAEDALLLGRLRARRLGFSEDRAEAPPLRAVLAVLDTLREITPALLAGSLVGRRIPLVLGEVPVDLDDRALLRGLFPEQIRLLPGQGRALAPAPVLRAVAATAPFGGWPAFGPLFQELARWDRLVAEELPDTRGGPDGGLAHGVRRGLLVDLLLSRGRGSSGHDGWTTVCRSLAPAVTAEALRRAFWLSTASTELGRIAEALPPRPSGSVARLRNWYGLPSEQGAQVEELVQRSAGVREELGDLPAEVEAGGLLGAHILRARLLPSNWVEGLRTPPFDVASVRRALAVWPLAEVPAADPTGALVLLLRLGELLCPTPGRRVGLARPADSEAGAALEVIVDGPTPPAAAHKATAALAVWPGGLPRLTIVGADPDGQRAVLALGLEEHSRVHQSPGTLAAAFQGAPASERPRLLSAFVEALTDADPKELADSVLALGDLDPDDAGSVLDGLLATGESVPAMAELVCFLDAKKTEIAGRAVLDSLSADRPHPEVVAAYRRIHGYLDETQQTRGARQILRLLRRSPDVPTIEAAAMATLGVDIACGDDTRAAFIAALQRRQSDGRLDTQVLAKALGRLERTRDVRGRS